MESHTSTPEWHVFEARMRQRHVERCVVQAAAALDAGALDVARAALDAALSLAPMGPDSDALTRLVGTADRPQPGSSSGGLIVAALLPFLSFGLGWLAAEGSTAEGAALLSNLLATASTVVMNIVNIVTSAGVPQSV